MRPGARPSPGRRCGRCIERPDAWRQYAPCLANPAVGHCGGLVRTMPTIRILTLSIAVAIPIAAQAAGPAPIFDAHLHYSAEARVRIIWAHSSFTTPPARIAHYLERYPGLVGELSYRHDVAAGGSLAPPWRNLFIAWPDRFVLDSDTWTNERWARYGSTLSLPTATGSRNCLLPSLRRSLARTASGCSRSANSADASESPRSAEAG